MPAPYNKILRLAKDASVDFADSALEKGFSGHDWRVTADATRLVKRPGLLPVAEMPAADAAYAAISGSVTYRPPSGVAGAGVYAVPIQARDVTWHVQTAGSDSAVVKRGHAEALFVASGRLYALRYVPAILLTSASALSYSLKASRDALVCRKFEAGVETASYTITETSTVADLATALSGTVATPGGIVTGRGYALGVAIAGLPAYCVRQGEFSYADNPTKLWLDVLIAYEVPLHQPADVASEYYRMFTTSDIAYEDSPVQMVQYGNSMLLAGQRKPLYSFDGFRAGLAGTYAGDATLTAVAGALPAATYDYIFRRRYVAPDGTSSYGLTFTKSITLAGPGAIQIEFSGTDTAFNSDYIAAGSVNSAASYTDLESSGGLSGMGAIFDYSDRSTQPKRPQIGETMCWYSSGLQENAIADVDDTLKEIIFDPAVTTPSTVMSLNHRIEVYRYSAAGTAAYLVEELPYAAGFTYTDTTADGTLVTNEDYVETAYTVIAPPSVVSAVTVHQNRAVVLGYDADPTNPYGAAQVNTVYYTEPNTQEFAADNSFNVILPRGDDLVAAHSVDDALYVGSRTGLWIVTGDLGPEVAFTVQRLPAGQGVASNCGFAEVRSNLFGLSKAGVFTLSGRAVDYAVGARVNPYISALPERVLARSRLAASEKLGWLFVILPGVSFAPVTEDTTSSGYLYGGPREVYTETDDTTVLVYDTQRDQWWLAEPGTPVAGGIVELDDTLLAFPKRQEAPICAFSEDWGRDGWEPIEMRIEGPWEDLDDPTVHKQFVRAQIMSTEEAGQNFALDVSTEEDWRSGQPVHSFTLDFGDGGGFGQGVYGTDPYGDPNTPELVRPLGNHKAKSMRLVVENDDPAEKPTISGWALEVAARAPNMKED